MFRVGIKADGNETIGLGHIMRSLTLAKEFKKNKNIVFFLSKYTQGIELIEQEGFQTFRVDNEEDIIKEIKQNDIQILIIDTYNIDEEFFYNIKKHLNKICYLDDINKFIYPVDVLINGNITAEYTTYKRYHESEIMLLGVKYNLIREEFKNISRRKLEHKVNKIMITTGGTDPNNLSVKYIRAILSHEQLNGLTINVIIGNTFGNKDELKRISQDNSNVILHENPKLMSTIMLDSDIAISAGGSTLYELCACGTPTIAFIMVDNQEFIVKKMDELGYIKSIGWYHKLGKNTLLNELNKLIVDYNLRQEMSHNGQKLVDGNGAKRIVREIEKLIDS